MKQTTLSMYVQAGYMLGMGLGLMFMPNVVLNLLGIEQATEVWIRILGALALTFSAYYFVLTRRDYVPFFRLSVWGRYFFCACLIVMAAIGIGPQQLYLLAGVEILLAAWTHLSLRGTKDI
ncbi:MAG: hypothetical protein SF052_10005 [Bacteroidia bacterium]|nr:hypothetical protein [Bacteroidia bacterium]